MQNSRHTFRGDKGPYHAHYRKNTFFRTKVPVLHRHQRVSLHPFRLLAQSGDHWITPVTAMPSGVFPVVAGNNKSVRAPVVWSMEKTDTLLLAPAFVT